MIWLILVATGAIAGLASGLFGIGGGLLVVPALLYLLKFPMHTASATSLIALMIPLGAWIGVYEYYSKGHINSQHFLYGLLICLGMAIGAFFGSRLAVSLDQSALQKAFAVFLVFAAVLTWFKA